MRDLNAGLFCYRTNTLIIYVLELDSYLILTDFLKVL
jgi:hypothetical protein